MLTDKITRILEDKFKIDHLKVSDETELHAGHPEAQARGGGHLSLVIVSADFQDTLMLQRHRMIYEALKEELKADLHALAIKALTPDEYEKA